MKFVYRVIFLYKYKNKNALSSCEIEDFLETDLCKLCVCDTPIARITGCVSLLRIYADDSPWNYSVASARVNSSSDANQSVRRNRKIWKR